MFCNSLCGQKWEQKAWNLSSFAFEWIPRNASAWWVGCLLLPAACCLRPSAFLFLMILQYCYQRVQTWIANTGKVAGPHRVMGPPLNQSISIQQQITAVHLQKGRIPFFFFNSFFFHFILGWRSLWTLFNVEVLWKKK